MALTPFSGVEPWALWPSASTSSPSAVSVTRTPSSVRAQAADRSSSGQFSSARARSGTTL